MAKRRELTEKEKHRAAVFKAAWDAKKEKENLNQGDAGGALDMSPSGFGQYINGKVPINLEAGLELCRYLDVAPEDVDLEKQLDVFVSIPSPLSPPAIKAGQDAEAEMLAMAESLSTEDLIAYLTAASEVLTSVDQIRLAESILKNARETLS